MATENLSLEEILMTDKLKTEFIDKINSNMLKLDSKYGQIKELLLDRTQRQTLMEAIHLIEKMYNTEDADITEDDVFEGKVGYNSFGKIVGKFVLHKIQFKNATVQSNATSVSFTFDFYPDKFYAFRQAATLDVYYTRYELINWDDDKNLGHTCYATGRDYYSHLSTGGTKSITENEDGTYTVTLTYNGTNQYISAGEWTAIAIPQEVIL